MHEERRPYHQPRPRTLDGACQHPDGTLALARMDERDLDTTEALAACRDDIADRFRPRDERKLPARFHDRAGGANPVLEQVAVHGMRFGLQTIRRAPIASIIE